MIKENALLPVHRPLVRNNVSVFVAQRTRRFTTEEREDRGECLALLRFEVFEFHDLDLLARKKFEDALQLAFVKSSLEICKTARLSGRRAGNARFFFPNRVKEIQRLYSFVSLHVPVSKRTLDRIPQ